MMAIEAKANSQSKPGWTKYVNPVNYVKGIGRFFVNSVHFVRDSFVELKRITWPSRDKVIRSSIVVLVSVIIITGFIWLVDSGFNQLLSYFLKLIG